MLQSANNSPVYRRIPHDGTTLFQMEINGSYTFQTAGCSNVRILASTGPVHIRLDDGDEIPMRAGMSYRAPNGFSKITLTNKTGAINAIDVIWSDGEIKDDALQLSGTVKTQVGNTVTGITHVVVTAGGTSTLVAALGTRRRITVKNSIANAYAFNIGGSGTAWSNLGVDLDPGEQMVFETSGQINVYNKAPYSQTIQCTVEAE